MPTIKIKGQGEIEVDIQTAKKIAEMKEKGDTPNSTWIKAGKWSGMFGDISGVVTTDNSNRTDEEKDYIKQIREERQSILKLTPEKRAKNTELFKLYYKAIKMKEAPEDVVQKVEELQKVYFEKYPQKCFTNYIVFNKVIYPDGIIPKNQKLSPIQMGVLNLVGNVLNQDVISSKYGN